MMEKEVGTANEILRAESSGGFNNFKETIYNIIGNSFNWLSTHQGFALILILCILALIIWLILRAKKTAKQLEEEVSNKKIELGKKDALIDEHKNKLEALQKKMDDQQGVVGEALFRTIKTLTGYDKDQLQIFFKFLTEIRGNPLQMAHNKTSTTLQSQQRSEKKSDNSAEEHDAKDKIVPNSGPEKVVDANKNEAK
ncbi:MAG: hypothetical protein PVF37_08025 [Desulfobacterales bacterium]|jgi:hypothetical protein